MEKLDYTKEEMSKDQIQHMISYVSFNLHVSPIESVPDKTCASTLNYVPMILQVTGTFLDLYSKSYYDMLVSSVST